MILMLMLTYLNEVAGHVINERVNWWLHALLILAFPPLILRSKHFHILMAPVDIFFRTFGLGEYVPLDLDEESLMESEEEIPLGLETIADTPWKMRMDFLTCVECRRCMSSVVRPSVATRSSPMSPINMDLTTSPRLSPSAPWALGLLSGMWDGL